MPPVTSYTKILTADQASVLRRLLEERGFDFVEKPHTLYAARHGGDQVSVAVYAKGPKVLAQGKGTESFVRFLLEPEVLGAAELGYEEMLHPERFEPHLGIDESGKGDFFGPLVVAGAYVDAAVARRLVDAGVVDSKRITSDARIRKLAEAIRSTPGLVSEVITIGPARYNELYEKIGNLNRLLAWGHARVIENLLARRPDCPRALSDQFANPAVLRRALQERGRAIELVQRTKAESDPAVAAASILARAAFVDWLSDQGRELGIEGGLPKGVSPKVVETARALVRREGPDALGRFAKLHFKTAGEVLRAATS